MMAMDCRETKDCRETTDCLAGLRLGNPVFSQMGGQATLQVDVLADQGILSYQWHMLQENKVTGLLPLSCYEEMGQVRLCWRVTSLQPLSVIFPRRKWTVGELLGLVRQCHTLLSRMDGLLLDGERLLLDNRFIMIDPVHLTLGFAYCPLMETNGAPDTIRQLLLHWLSGECPLSGQDTTGRLADLLLMLQDVSFHWSRLSALFVGTHPDSGAVARDLAEKANNETDTVMPQENAYALTRANRYAEALPGSSAAPDGLGLAYIKPEACQTVQTNTHGKRAWAPDWRRIVPIQIIVCGSLAATFSGGILTQHGPDGTMARFGMLLLGVALEVWAFSSTREAAHASGDHGAARVSGAHASTAASGQPASRPSNGLAVTETHPFAERTEARPFQRVISKEMGCDLSGKPQPRLEEGCFNETSLLARAEGPCLYHHAEDEPVRRIPVTKTPFLIGRLREQVDGWLGHPAVGKLHAEIRIAQGAHCLVDLNSRNGTSVNGVALKPYVPCVLHANDQIRISDETLVFHEQ